MSRSLYKSTLDFLISQSRIKAEGNHLRRLQTLCSMVCSCIGSKKSTLEGISSWAEQVNSESTLKQSKRWLDSKWSDWESFFAPYIVGVLNKAMSQGEVIVLVDGSETAGNCVTLMISFMWGDYAIVWRGKGHADPIFLLTNMELGAMACRYYRKRFKIENLFKS